MYNVSRLFMPAPRVRTLWVAWVRVWVYVFVCPVSLMGYLVMRLLVRSRPTPGRRGALWPGTAILVQLVQRRARYHSRRSAYNHPLSSHPTSGRLTGGAHHVPSPFKPPGKDQRLERKPSNKQARPRQPCSEDWRSNGDVCKTELEKQCRHQMPTHDGSRQSHALSFGPWHCCGIGWP